MMSMEQAYFDLATTSKKNCLIICDRGTMDASACQYGFHAPRGSGFLTFASDRAKILQCRTFLLVSSLVVSKEIWDRIIKAHGWNTVDLRDNRYNQIIHLVSVQLTAPGDVA